MELVINPNFTRNLFIIFSGMSPIFAVLIERLTFLNMKKWFITIQSIFVAIIVYMLMAFPTLKGKTVPSILVLYPLFLLAFNFLFFYRFGVQHFSKGLSLSLMLTFVLTEMHEIPMFIVSYVKLTFLDPGKLANSIAPIYALVVGYLATKTAELKISKSRILGFALGISSLFPLYLLNPQLDISANPHILSFAKRIFCFLVLSTTFYHWSGIKHAST